MTRLCLARNFTEDEMLARLDRAFARERAAPPSKPKRVLPPDFILLNGKRYVAQTDRSAAEALFKRERSDG